MDYKSRIFITGDKHGEWKELKDFCYNNNTTTNDYIIVLGDLCANYFQDYRDKNFKKKLAKCPITIIAIHGNHEERPCNISSYKIKWFDSVQCNCWYEEEYPNIIFPDDGEELIINGDNFLVLGGAYSVDKAYRIMNGWNWFESEQMSDKTKQKILKFLDTETQFRYVLSHTCPINFEPRHLFMKDVNQDTVDKTMEIFLQEVYDKLDKDFLVRWFFGHYHADERISDKLSILYNGIIEITDFVDNEIERRTVNERN